MKFLLAPVLFLSLLPLAAQESPKPCEAAPPGGRWSSEDVLKALRDPQTTGPCLTAALLSVDETGGVELVAEAARHLRFRRELVGRERRIRPLRVSAYPANMEALENLSKAYPTEVESAMLAVLAAHDKGTAEWSNAFLMFVILHVGEPQEQKAARLKEASEQHVNETERARLYAAALRVCAGECFP